MGWWSSPGFSLSCFGGCRTGFEAEAVIAGFEDVAMTGGAIEQGRNHLGITEDPSPSQ
jgi:hypothetical protein